MATATSVSANFTAEAAALASAVEEVASFVAGFEPERYSASDAASLVNLFERGKRLCVAGETLSASRAAEGNAHHLSGHRTPDEWLSAVTGSSKGEAMGILKVGEALWSQPEVEDALRGGKLTSAQATLVTDAVKVNPGCEQDLVRGAEQDTLPQFEGALPSGQGTGSVQRTTRPATGRHCTTTGGVGPLPMPRVRSALRPTSPPRPEPPCLPL